MESVHDKLFMDQGFKGGISPPPAEVSSLPGKITKGIMANIGQLQFNVSEVDNKPKILLPIAMVTTLECAYLPLQLVAMGCSFFRAVRNGQVSGWVIG
jgi:hypothetical protein